MADLPRFHSPKDYLDLARSDAVTPQQLRGLANSPYGFVLQAVAANPSTPPDVLMSLMPDSITSWNDSNLLLTLVRNPASPTELLAATPEMILSRLGVRDDHKAFEAGVALAQRPDTADAVLVTLIEDPRATTEFRKVVARETTHSALRDLLKGDRSERVRRAAQRSAPDRLDMPVGPLVDAYDVVVADIRSTASPEPMMVNDDWARDLGRPAAMLRWPDGTGCGVSVWSDWSLVANVVLLADQIQEQIVEELCRLGRPAVWPECPDHPDSHPSSPWKSTMWRLGFVRAAIARSLRSVDCRNQKAHNNAPAAHMERGSPVARTYIVGRSRAPRRPHLAGGRRCRISPRRRGRSVRTFGTK